MKEQKAQRGKLIFETLMIYEAFQLTKNGEVCNFHHR